MNLAYLNLPMVLFTTLAPMASGAFVGLAIAFLTTRFSTARLARIDRWTLLPLVILMVGVGAALVYFSTPAHGLFTLQGIGGAPFAFAVFMAVLFAVVAVVYWIIAMTGKLGDRARAVFASVVAVLALVYAAAIGAPYAFSTVSSWSSPLVMLALVGFCVAGGVPLGVLVVALAGGLVETRRTRFAAAAVVAAFLGTVLAIFAVTVQLLNAQATLAAFFPGADVLPGSWVYLVISIVGFVVMLACLRTALSPDRTAALGRTAGAVAAVPVRERVDAQPVGLRSAVPLLVGGNAAVLAAIFVARLMFYALQV